MKGKDTVRFYNTEHGGKWESRQTYNYHKHFELLTQV